jgi:hypothetical protein
MQPRQVISIRTATRAADATIRMQGTAHTRQGRVRPFYRATILQGSLAPYMRDSAGDIVIRAVHHTTHWTRQSCLASISRDLHTSPPPIFKPLASGGIVQAQTQTGLV